MIGLLPSKVRAQFTKNIFCWILQKKLRNIQNSCLAFLTPWVRELVAISLKDCFDGRHMKCSNLDKRLHSCKFPTRHSGEIGVSLPNCFAKNYIKFQALNRKPMFGNASAHGVGWDESQFTKCFLLRIT